MCLNGSIFFIFLLVFMTVQCVSSLSASSLTSSTLSLKKIPKLILLDRDGVVNEDVGSPGVVDKSQLKLTPGAGPAVGRLRRAGCKVALITNQSCVGKGLITEETLVHSIHDRMQAMLANEDVDATFDHIFYCTSLNASDDYRFKPNPGMIKEAMELFGIKDPSDAVFIGDTLTDMEAASRAVVPVKILVSTGYGRGIMGGESAPDKDGTVKVVTGNESNVVCEKMEKSIFPFLYASHLSSAVEWILVTSKKRCEEK